MRTPHLLAIACTSGDPGGPYRHAELSVWDELRSSLEQYPRRWRSPEEGAMVLGEEVDELWDEVRGNHLGRARAEATQVGAMAVRFIADLCEPAGSPLQRCRAAAAARPAHEVVGPAHRTLASSHEGFGFLKREYDALWAVVVSGDSARTAAGRVAAMAVRFIAEIVPPTITVSAR